MTLLPPLDYDPMNGIVVKDSDSIQWLLAGGAPINNDNALERAWADTEIGDYR